MLLRELKTNLFKQINLGFKLCKETFYSMFVQISTYVIIIGCLLLNAIFILICPLLIMHNQEDWTIVMMSNMTTMATISFFCSAIGEMVANPNDRLFILCRPIRRSYYLTIKVLISIFFSALLASIISLFHYGLWELNLKNSSSSLNVNLDWKILSIFIMSIFGGTLGVIFRFYLKDMLTTIIVLIVTMFYSIFFIVYSSQFTAQTLNPGKLASLTKLEYYYLPLCLLLPLTLTSIVIGYIMNHKSDIGS